MKRSLDITNSSVAEPPRKRLKVLHIRRPGRVPKYTTRSLSGAVRTIARFWRAYRTLIPSDNVTEEGTRGYIRRHGKNVICPITQDIIPSQKCFKFVSVETGHVHAYTVDDLVGYFKSSGNFRCPLTREEFNRPTVRRLMKRALQNGIPAFNLSGIYEMRDSIMRRTIERENRVLAIENQCALAMTEALDMCANLDVSTVAAANQLMNYLLPEWKQLVDDYIRYYPQECRTMLLSDKDKMLRLRRSDMRDPHNLINLVREAIDTKLEQVNRPMVSTVSTLNPRLPVRRSLFQIASSIRPPSPNTMINNVVADILNAEESSSVQPPPPPSHFLPVQEVNETLEDLNRRLLDTLSQNNRSGRVRYFFPPPDSNY